MPLFMDLHQKLPEGATAKDVADAHMADLETQDKFGVKHINYWLDEKGGKVFCLIEAPDAEAAEACHREAHGLTATRSTKSLRGSRCALPVGHGELTVPPARARLRDGAIGARVHGKQAGGGLLPHGSPWVGLGLPSLIGARSLGAGRADRG